MLCFILCFRSIHVTRLPKSFGVASLALGYCQWSMWAKSVINWHSFGSTLAQGTASCLTHWGRVSHGCVSKLTTVGSDNGLSPGRRQAIIWTNAGVLLMVPLRTKFSEILIEIHTFSFKKMHLKMSSAKWRSFCLGLNVLTAIHETPDFASVRFFGIHNNFTSAEITILYNEFGNYAFNIIVTSPKI